MTSSIRTTRTDRPASADRDGYGATIMHNDGTVTWWSSLSQTWLRGIPSDYDLSCMCAYKRDDVLQHLANHELLTVAA